MDDQPVTSPLVIALTTLWNAVSALGQKSSIVEVEMTICREAIDQLYRSAPAPGDSLQPMRNPLKRPIPVFPIGDAVKRTDTPADAPAQQAAFDTWCDTINDAGCASSFEAGWNAAKAAQPDAPTEPTESTIGDLIVNTASELMNSHEDHFSMGVRVMRDELMRQLPTAQPDAVRALRDLRAAVQSRKGLTFTTRQEYSDGYQKGLTLALKDIDAAIARIEAEGRS